MNSIAQSFGMNVGYSDHTQGISIAVAAVAMGAKIIEKHLTLDKMLPGPDHKASLEPDEFLHMVQCIRSVEKALGDGIKRVTASEKQNLSAVRKSIVAARNIKAGEVFNNTNLSTKRPGDGISPMQWDSWIGKKAVRDFTENEQIE